jgi:protein-tyrosine-phosphatase
MIFPPILIPCLQDRAAQQAARSLFRAGYPVIGALPQGRGRRTGLDPRHLRELVECPDPLRRHREFRQWLGGYLGDHPSALVLPVHEAVVHAANQLRQAGVPRERFVLANPQGLANALSKFIATRSATLAGIDTPDTFFLRAPGESEYAPLPAEVKFPCLLKWDNCEDEEGAYHKGSNRKIADRAELDAVLAELRPFSCGVIAQNLVPGHGVGAFFLRHNGRIILRFAHRRLHEVPWTGGESSHCESSGDAEVLDAGESLLQAIGYEGVAMVEFRKEQGKPPRFLEINGRLWGSLGLAIAAGADFPRAMVECHLHGESQVKQPDLSRRVRWREPSLEMDYLRSLWEQSRESSHPSSPRIEGSFRTLRNMIDPRVTSDWPWRGGLWSTLRRHLGLWRRQGAWLAQALRRRREHDKPDPLVAEAVARTLAMLGNAAKSPPRTLLFLCYGNICRSPYAEYRWQQLARAYPSLAIPRSAGFHDKVERSTPVRFQSAARHRDVELHGHRSIKISQTLIDDADWILVMDEANLRSLQQGFPAAMEKVLMLGACDAPENPTIPDPYGRPIGEGCKAYARIDAALFTLKERILKNL